MKRLLGPTVLVLLALAMPAQAEEPLPITIAPGSVTGEPEVNTRFSMVTKPGRSFG